MRIKFCAFYTRRHRISKPLSLFGSARAATHPAIFFANTIINFRSTS